jgi:hypothetical protein
MELLDTLLRGIPPLLWLALVLGLALAWWWRDGREGRRSRRRVHAALRAEDEAEQLLVSLGYQIEDRQVAGCVRMEIDGVLHELSCRADLMVSRGEELLIAEVKSGALVADPTRPSTRRQLLEYQLAFEVDGVLMVDMERGRVHRIHFP